MGENFEQRFEDEQQLKQEVLEIVKNETKERLKDINDYHGQEHTELVVEKAKLLALGEEQDPFNAEVAGWVHDWGRVEEKTDPQKRKHAKLSFEDSRKFFRQLWKEGKLTPKQFHMIEEGVLFHSTRRETQFENLKITRDADRLSRFGSMGIYHVILGSQDQKIPFYLAGQEIIRPEDAPVIISSDVKCVIDDLNFCFDWVKMMETDSGKKLVEKLKRINQSFLQLFSKHQEITDENLWLAFVKKIADDFREKKRKFEENYQWQNSKEDFSNWLKFYEEAENPEIFSEENFQKFLNEYKK